MKHIGYVNCAAGCANAVAFEGPDPRYEIIDPKVQRHGDVAALTFNPVNYRKLGAGEKSVVARWNSTEVYFRIEGKWRIIHGHWSYIKPQVRPGGP